MMIVKKMRVSGIILSFYEETVMGPKKKGGKKDKGGGDGSVGAITGDNKEAQLEAYSKAMELQLAFNNEVRTDAEEDARRNKARMKQVNSKYEEQKSEMFDLTRDMTRQYKDMQEELLHKINLLEGTIQELKDELETDRSSFQNTLRKKDQTIESNEKTISELKNKMEGMAEDFGDMLKRTLKKMQERIELNSANYEEQAVPIQKRLQEYQVNK